MRKALLITLLVNMFILLPAIFFASYQLDKHLLDEQRVLSTDELSQCANTLSRAIQKRFALLEGLSAFVIANPSQEQLDAKFETFASALPSGVGGIRNFVLAPDGVNSYVYPLKRNELVLGHNLIADPRPNVRVDVQRAIRTQRITLSGPYELRQGGLGFVARKAVFLGEKFWGFVSMVVDIPPLLEDAGLGLPSEKSDISLRKNGGEYFYGAERVVADSAISLRINLPDGFWEIGVAANRELLPQFEKQQTIFNGFASISLVFLSLLIYTIANRQTYLSEKVKEQTSDLEEKLIAQRLAEDDLRDEKNRIKTILDLVGDPIFVKDNDHRITVANRAFYDLFCMDESSVIGKTLVEAVPENERQHFLEIDRKVLDTGMPDLREEELTVKGCTRTIITRKIRFIDESGVKCMVGSIHDITQRKLAGKEKIKLEGQLHQAQKIESIGQLAGGIAHDFNNILAGLYGNLSLAKASLTKSLPDHPGYRYLEAAERSMNRATALTNQLLTFAKGGVPTKETLSLSHLIEEVVSFTLSGSNVKPIIDLPDNLWLAFIDQGQIQQVLGNLTINAKQAMPGGGELQITLENTEVLDNQLLGLDGGNYIRVTLADNGTGIAPEHLERIFEPYFTTKQAGNGLGLATVYSIITKHGGHISVASQLGQGTTFTLYLPAAKNQKLPPVPTVSVTAPLHQAARVLVMDDEEMICNIVKAMLEEAGHTVEAVPDGALALDRYRQALETDSPFDLVILDLTIPGGMGGKEVAEQILALHPLAKIIVSSGYADDPVRANYADYGLRAFVPKPFELGELIDTVSKVFMSDSA